MCFLLQEKANVKKFETEGRSSSTLGRRVVVSARAADYLFEPETLAIHEMTMSDFGNHAFTRKKPTVVLKSIKPQNGEKDRWGKNLV